MKGARIATWLNSPRRSVIFGAVSAWISLLALFAFRNVPYLSDGTFYISEWPLLCFSVVAVFLLINLVRVLQNRTRLRTTLLILSALAVVSVPVNAFLHAAAIKRETAHAGLPHPAGRALPPQPEHAANTFLAGAAKGDITPSDYLMPMPLILGLKFRSIHDPVHARVLAMSDGEQQYLFITLDMTLVPRADETLRFIHEQTGVPVENILISATHTHGVTPISLFDYTSPADERKAQRWYEQIKRTLIATIAQAQADMVPARYGYGEGQSHINVNRDIVIGEKSILGSNFDRPSDKTIRMVRIEDMNGKVISLIVNYAVHCVVMNGLISGLGTPLTGDLAGATSTKIESRWKDAVVLWTVAAAGDQNPKIMAQYSGSMKDGKPFTQNLGRAAYAVLDSLSDEHVRDILKADANIQATQTSPSIRSAEATVLVDTVDDGEKQPYKLTLLALGDIAFQGISAEVVTSIGKAVREASPFDNTILVTLANGYEGYVTDEWQHEHQAFGVGNLVKGAAQVELVKGFIRLSDEIRHQK